MADFKDLLRDSNGPADSATILIAGTAGFVIDAALSVHGVFSPGTVGALSASGALGLKKAWEARRAMARSADEARREKEARDSQKHQAYERADYVVNLLDRGGHSHEPQAQRLRDEMTLVVRGLSNSETLEGVVNEVIDHYRSALAR